MPTVTVPGKDVQFFFHDTGAPLNIDNYTTLVLVHGHTFHGSEWLVSSIPNLTIHQGVFQRLFSPAVSRGVRIICINRREYPGSTPHTKEELHVYASGSETERQQLLHDAGVDLALCLDAVIQQCALSAVGGVALCGLSLGNTFVLAAVASIAYLPPQSQERLAQFVKCIIMWGAAHSCRAYQLLNGHCRPTRAVPWHRQRSRLISTPPRWNTCPRRPWPCLWEMGSELLPLRTTPPS